MILSSVTPPNENFSQLVRHILSPTPDHIHSVQFHKALSTPIGICCTRLEHEGISIVLLSEWPINSHHPLQSIELDIHIFAEC